MWTYLDLVADVEAVRLRLTGLTSEGDVVAVNADRGYGAVVSLLGCLASGRVYLPLDPEWPTRRREEVLSAAGAAAEARVTGQGGPSFATLPYPRRDLPPGLAYIIFTSGSTGRPKGVMVGAQAFDERLRALSDLLRQAPECRMVLNTSISFDISLLEMVLPLLVGGTVLCVPRPTTDLNGFTSMMARSRPTHVQGTPTFFTLMERVGWPIPEDAEIWSGGEPLNPRLAHAMLNRFRRVRNLYGPTEATIWCTYQDVTEANVASVGRPFGGTGVYIETAAGDVAPDDGRDIGEVVIFGSGLAEGYVDPTQDEGRFFTHPDRGRCYRTGDLGYLDGHGHLHLKGRKDDQVKVHGHRIELGDIEVNLEEHPSVHRCAVTVRRDADGSAQLVAYVVMTDLGLRELRSFARERLPHYAVPHRFRLVDQLPVNTAGKIDRRSLREYEQGHVG